VHARGGQKEVEQRHFVADVEPSLDKLIAKTNAQEESASMLKFVLRSMRHEFVLCALAVSFLQWRNSTAWRTRAVLHPAVFGNSWTRTPRAAIWAFWESRASACWN
jgi:hypothetical protein